MSRVGILALQGAFVEHAAMLHKLGIQTFEIRQLSDWLQNEADGLILPGGESTTMRRLMAEEGLLEPLQSAIQGGMPVMGTCAGLILLAREVRSSSELEAGCLGTLDVRVIRNAYGRQLGSFTTYADVVEVGTDVPLTFIRAPYIEKTNLSGADRVKELCSVNGNIVAVRQDNQLGCAFHPELTDDLRWHQKFVEML